MKREVISSNNNSNERRVQERFAVQNGAFAVFSPREKIGNIVDINNHGIAISYLSDIDWSSGFEEVSIFMASEGFELNNVPILKMCIEKIDSNSILDIEFKRRGLKFGSLSQKQISMLDYFIENHTN